MTSVPARLRTAQQGLVRRLIRRLLQACCLSLALLVAGTAPALAATKTWTFDSPDDYTFDERAITIISGTAQLAAVGGPTWFDQSWTVRRPVTIDNRANPSALSDYPVKVVVPYDAGMQPEFGDIRFTDEDGTTLLPHWRESFTAFSAAVFWVKVPALAGSSTHTIYLYYANDGVSSASDESSTFAFFDDFTSVYGVAKSPDNPIFDGVQPSIIKEGSEYWIYYNVGLHVYRRTSADGESWGPPTLVLAPGRYVDVAKDGSTYRMVYNDGDVTQVRLATSPDGVVWTDGGLLVNRGSENDWDAVLVSDPSEIRVGDTYYLFYGGTGTNGEAAIGLATSPTGLPGSYTKHPGNPILTKSGSGLQSEGVFDADVFEHDTGKYMMFYTGFDGGTQRATYATSTDLTSWTRSDTELYWKSQSWEEPATYGPNEPTVLIEDSMYKVWYRGNPGAPQPDAIGHLVISQDRLTKEPDPGARLSDDWPSTASASVSTQNGTMSITSPAPAYVYSAHHAIGDGVVEARMKYVYRTNGNLCGRIDPGNWRDYCTGSAGIAGRLYLFEHRPEFQSHAYGLFDSGADFVTYKLALSGTSLRAKAWAHGDAEPAAWTVQSSDTSLSSGPVGFYTNSTTVSIDWIRVRPFAASEPSTIVGAATGVYFAGAPGINPVSAQAFTSLTGIASSETTNGGGVRYQISNDRGATWYWYDSGWVATSTGYREANDMGQVNANIATFPTGPGSFLFRAFLISDGSQQVELDDVTLTYGD